MKLTIFILYLLSVAVKADFENSMDEELVGTPCLNDDQCNKGGLKGNCSSGFCMCTSLGKWIYCQFQNPILGTPLVGNNLPCNHDDDCRRINNARCLPRHDGIGSVKVCQCDAHMAMNANNTECIETLHIPKFNCTNLSQCMEAFGKFSECVKGECSCKSNYHYVADVNNHCVANKAYGENCTQDKQSCYQSSRDLMHNVLECSDGVCKCIKNYSFYAGLCRSLATQIIPQVLILTILIAITTRFL